MASTDPVKIKVPVKVILTGEILVTVDPKDLDETTSEAIIKRAEELALEEAEDGWSLDEFNVLETEVYDQPETVEA